MCDASVGAVAHGDGFEQRRRLALLQARKKSPQPRRILGRAQHAPHALRLDQRRRKKVLAAWFPRLAVGVVREPRARFVACDPEQRIVAAQRRVLQRERERERAVGVRAGAHRIRRIRQIPPKSLREGARQRRERLRAAAAVVVGVPRQLGLQHQQPCPPVRPFERTAPRLLEIRQLAGDVLWRELRVEQGADARGFRQRRKRAQERAQQPVAVHARMPVEAAVEDRVERARALQVAGPAQHVVELVRVLTRHVSERERGEARREPGGQIDHTYAFHHGAATGAGS